MGFLAGTAVYPHDAVGLEPYVFFAPGMDEIQFALQLSFKTYLDWVTSDSLKKFLKIILS